MLPTARIKLVVLLVILIATTIVYLPGLSGGFGLDDFGNIVHNEAIHLQSLDWGSLHDAIISFGGSTFKRPISMASFALNWYWFGPEPTSFKLVNLIIHLANGLAVYGLMVLIMLAPFSSHRLNANSRRWLPLVVTALWLFHPLQVSTVLYIYQRMAELGTLFLLLGCASYTLARLRMVKQQGGWLLPMLATFLVFMPLSLFSKETGLLLPLFTALIDISLFRFQDHRQRTDWRILSVYLAVLAITLAKIVIGYGGPYSILTGHLNYYEVREFTLQERLLTQPRVVWFYLKMLLFPDLHDMGLFHDDLPLSHDWWTPPSTLPAMASLAALAVAGLLLVRPRPLIGFGILWFFIGHLLESTIAPLEMVYEHRNYLPSVGIAIAVTAWVFDLFGRGRSSSPGIIVSLLLASTLLFLTQHRASTWGDELLFHQTDVIHHPASGRALVAAGTAFAKYSSEHDGSDWDTALAYLLRARSLDPSILPEISLMIYSFASTQPIDPGWYDAALAKLSSRPLSASNLSALFALTQQLSKNKTPLLSDQQAITLYETALNHPRSKYLAQQRQIVYHYYGRYLSRNWRKPETASAWLEKRLQAHPNDLVARMQLIVVYDAIAKRTAARQQLLTLIRLDSDNKYPGFIREASRELLTGAQPSAKSTVMTVIPKRTQ